MRVGLSVDGVDTGMRGPAFRDKSDRIADALDRILEAEAGSSNVGRPGPDLEPIVEPAAGAIANV